MGEDIQGDGEDDCGVLFCRDRIQGLKEGDKRVRHGKNAKCSRELNFLPGVFSLPNMGIFWA